MNSCGCQCKSLRSKRLEILWCCWLAPQAIGGEEKLVANGIKHFHSYSPWLLIIHDLGEVSIIKQEMLNLDPKLSLRAHIQPVTTDTSWTYPICPPSSNGTNLQFQLYIFSRVVNICKSDRGALNRIQRLIASRVCGSILRDGPLVNWHTDGVPPGVPANASWRSWASIAGPKLLQPASTCHQIILAKESSRIRLPRWTF